MVTTLKVWTSRYGYSGPDRLDITVKGKDPLGKYFAPTWPMVQSYIKGRLTEKYYEKQYRDMMLLSYANNLDKWRHVFNMGEVTFVCFCKPGSFCHRYILRDFLNELANGRDDLTIQLMGERHI
jgi:uncharacterized protein YeaO (DUF488 family)